MDRFKMNFGNPNNQYLVHEVGLNQKSMKMSPTSRSINIRLNSSMIDRVHKTRSGCSVCGKKAM
jgi:predicted DNA binding CopG/RHH family protein